MQGTSTPPPATLASPSATAAAAGSDQRYDFSPIDALVAEHLDRTFPAAQIEIGVAGTPVYSRAWGYLDPDTRLRPTTVDSHFDLASVSKLFTIAAFMTLVEQGRLALDQSVSEILGEFAGKRPIVPDAAQGQNGKSAQPTPAPPATIDAGTITFRQLLAHNSGLPAWLPLWSIPRREERRDAVLNTVFSYATGAHVVYSDIGLILLGYAAEKVAGQPLDQIIRARVTGPLGLASVGFGPIPRDRAVPTAFNAYQYERMWGEVHDENVWSLGGVAGHAGIFSTARDLMRLGEMYKSGGGSVLKRETVAEMTRLQSEEGTTRRGLGFVLWSPDPQAISSPFSSAAFGHTGFTGTSLWIDPGRSLVIACLTNRVYSGKDNANEIAAFRIALHRAATQAVDSAAPK